MEVAANMYEFILDGNNIHRKKDVSSINNTQRIVRDIKKRKYGETDLVRLVSKLSDAELRAWDTGENFIDSFDIEFTRWELCSNNKKEEDRLMNCFNELIDQFRNEEDFCFSYIINDITYTLWVIIKDACFENNRKYLRAARNYKRENNLEFNLIIFDEDQVKELEEQLQYMENYIYAE